VTLNNGERLIAKHKRDEFRETKTPRVLDPEKMVVLQVAEAIADEWVTAERFKHVVDQLLRERDHKQVEMSDAGALIKLMYTDVLREAAGEIVFTKELSKAIGAVTVKLLKASMEQRLRGA
jgi:hypothetical protein